MRPNLDRKTIDVEPRDMNFILSSYIRTYLFFSRNEDPEEIIVPMMETAPHPFNKNKRIPVRFIPTTDPDMVEIVQDTNNVPEADSLDEAEKLGDEKESKAKRMRETLESIAETETPASTPQDEPGPTFTLGSNPPPEGRTPKQPDKVATGSLDDNRPRDKRDQKRVAKDIRQEPDIDESEEKEYEKKVVKGPDGKPAVED